MAPTTRTTQVGKQGATMDGNLARRAAGEVAPDWETAAAKAERYQQRLAQRIGNRLLPGYPYYEEAAHELLSPLFSPAGNSALKARNLTRKSVSFHVRKTTPVSAFLGLKAFNQGAEEHALWGEDYPNTTILNVHYNTAGEEVPREIDAGLSVVATGFTTNLFTHPGIRTTRFWELLKLPQTDTSLSDYEQHSLINSNWHERVMNDPALQKILAAYGIMAAFTSQEEDNNPNSKMYRVRTNANRWAGELLRAHYLTGSGQLDCPDQERASILLAPEEGRPEREHYNAVFDDMAERIRNHPQLLHHPAEPEADARSAVLPEVTLDDDRRVSLSLHARRHWGSSGSDDSINLHVVGGEKWFNRQVLGMSHKDFLALVPTENEADDDPTRDQRRQHIYDLYMNGRVGMHVLRRHDGSFALVPDAAIRQTTFADGGVGTDLVIPDTDPRFSPTLKRLVHTFNQAMTALERQAQPSLLDMMAADAKQQAKEEQGPRASLIARWALRLLGIGQDDLEEVRAGRAGSSLGSHNNRALKPWWLGGRRG